MANNNDNKVLNVPNLRFPEFSGEWSSQPLTNFMSFKNGMNPDAKRFGHGTKFISVMDVLNNQYICYDNIRASVELQDGDIDTYGVNYGDILFQRSSETLEDVGQANVYLDSKPAIFGGFVIRGKSKGNYNPLFFRYLLVSPTARKRIIVKGAGAQHFNIGQDGLSKVSLDIPCMQEQKKIGKLLQCVDARIATQTKIIEKYESLIKGLIETCISSSEANTRIADCLECHSSTLQESQLSEVGTFPVYGATGISGYMNSADVKGESILIIKDGSRVGSVRFANGEYSVIGTLNRLTAQNGYCLKYIYFVMQMFNFEPYKTGLAIPHIYFKDYGKAKIYCPTIEQQNLVAKNLSIIEDKIETEKQLLLCLRAQKTYLLSQLFI